MNITGYDSLLSAAKQQPEPQRLLFVFLEVSQPEGSAAHSGEGGELQPIMCADKVLSDLGTFSDLVEESKQMGKDWQIVLVASLSGRNGTPPSSSEAEKPLKMMIETVQTGGDLSKYMAFDKGGVPIEFT